MTHKSVKSDSAQSFGSSGRFNVNSLTKTKEDSNSSINPFSSLRMYVRRDPKDGLEKRRTMTRSYLKKDDFTYRDIKEMKGRKSPDQGSLTSVGKVSLSFEKLMKEEHKSDSKDKDTSPLKEAPKEVQRTEKGGQSSGDEKNSSKEDGKAGKEPDVK